MGGWEEYERSFGEEISFFVLFCLISESAGWNSQLWNHFYLFSTAGSRCNLDDSLHCVSTVPVSNCTQFRPLDLQLFSSKGVVLRLEVAALAFTLTSSYSVFLKQLVEFQLAKMKHIESTFQCHWNHAIPLSTLGVMSLTMGRGHWWFSEHTYFQEILCKQPWMSFLSPSKTQSIHVIVLGTLVTGLRGKI